MTEQDKFAAWRVKLLHYLFSAAIMAFIIEFVGFFFLDGLGVVTISTPGYYMKFVFFPTALNCLMLAVGRLLVHRKKMKEEYKNYVPILCCMLLCLQIAVIHNFFYITAAVFVFPMFLSIIFENLIFTRNTFLICLIGFLLSALNPWYDAEYHQEDWSISEIIGLVILICAYMLSRIIIQFLQEKEKQLRESFRHSAMLKEDLKRDRMTGLYNHVEFYHIIESKIRDYRSDTPLSIAVFDLDNFKRINDTYGHSAGDNVLKAFASILQMYEGENTLPCRYGGEEFIIVSLGQSESETAQIADAIRRAIEGQLILNKIKVTVSCGIAGCKKGQTAQQLFEHADQALYKAKQNGRNRIVIYTPKIKGD